MKNNESKQWYKKWWIWVIIVLLLLGAIGTLGEKEEPSQESQTSTEESKDTSSVIPAKEEVATPVVETQLSDSQKKFISLVDDGKVKYNAASTDLQKSDAIRTRDSQICSVVGAQFTDWSGTIKDIGANGQGKAHVSIQLSPSVRVSTWNNAVSDYADNTLIPQGSDLYNTLVKMEKGAKVKASGSFVAADGACIKATNVTQTFRAIDPDYLVRFTSVKAE